MSATVIPDLTPSRCTSWLGSPASSRSFSSCQIGLIMSAIGRSGFGKEAAGVPGPAMKSWAETDIVNAAAKTTTIVIRITLRITLPVSDAIAVVPEVHSRLRGNERNLLDLNAGTLDNVGPLGDFGFD